jgi:hypothetical protein
MQFSICAGSGCFVCHIAAGRTALPVRLGGLSAWKGEGMLDHTCCVCMSMHLSVFGVVGPQPCCTCCCPGRAHCCEVFLPERYPWAPPTLSCDLPAPLQLDWRAGHTLGHVVQQVQQVGAAGGMVV